MSARREHLLILRSQGCRWGIAALLATYLVLAVIYSLNSPLYEPTDELRHFRYVRHIAVYRTLPVQQAEGPRAQSHHPPLYYALGALIAGWVPVAEDVYYEPPVNPYWGYRVWEVSDDNKNQYLHRANERFPFRGIALAVYLVRWMTVLMGAAAVFLTYRLGQAVCPGRVDLALAAAAIVAFTPQFLHLSGAINNDIPATLCSVAVLLACVRMTQSKPSLRQDILLGTLYGLALLTKFNLTALIVPIEIAYLMAAWPKRDWRAFLRGNLIVLGLVGLLAGWWFWRNYVLYGDPTGMRKVNELWAGREPAESGWALLQSMPYLWSTLWGRFGYGQVPLPDTVYQAIGVLCLIALCGYAVPCRTNEPPNSLLVFLGITCTVFVAVVAYYILIQPAGAMGRFLFPALPAFALLLVLGARRYLPYHKEWLASLALGAAALGLAVYALIAILRPAFAPPRPLTDRQIAQIPHRIDVQFDNVARLLGYEVQPMRARPGERVAVTLYWQTLARTERDYAVFVHLLSETGTMIAQRDTYPGLGRYPTSTWDPGVAFADTYRVDIPETAYAPDRGYIQVGLYDPNGPRLQTSNGQDAVRLAEIEILAHPGDVPNPLKVNFGDQVELAGYEIDRRTVRPGERTYLTLYWRSLRPLEEDYGIFAHILGPENQIWARDDGWPRSGNLPTSEWKPGELVKEIRTLEVVPSAPPGFYELEVGVYNAAGERLPVLGQSGQWLGDRVLLCTVRVLEENGE